MTTNIKADSLGSIVEGKRAAAESAGKVGYTQAKLAKLSGISRDQLKRWDRAGLLRPARQTRGKAASDCRYSLNQALGVMALGQLRRFGVREKYLRDASAILPPLVAEYAHLVFDGRMLYARETDAEAVELLRERAGFVLSVRALAEKLA